MQEVLFSIARASIKTAEVLGTFPSDRRSPAFCGTPQALTHAVAAIVLRGGRLMFLVLFFVFLASLFLVYALFVFTSRKSDAKTKVAQRSFGGSDPVIRALNRRRRPARTRRTVERESRG
jgi:hypothetical protein